MDITTVLIPLPLYYNADSIGHRSLVEDSKFLDTARELARQFGGGAVWKTPPEAAPQGFWWDRGLVERDVLPLSNWTSQIRRPIGHG